MHKAQFILAFLLIISCSVWAQECDSTAKNCNGISLRMHYGFFIAHRYNVQHMSNAHFPLAEINYNIQPTGSQNWHQKYFYPTYGIGYCVTNAGNKNLMGLTQALFPYVNFNYLHKYRVSANFRLGFGLGYIDKPFNRITNHANLAIGSKLNAYVNIGQDLKIKLSKRSTFNFGVHLHHQSNGAFKVPNLGINLATVSTGLTYYFCDLPCTLQSKKDTVKYHSKFETIVSFGGFVKEIYPIGGPKYKVFVASVNALRRYNEKSRWGFGLDYMRNSAIKQYNATDGIEGNEDEKIGQIGATITYEVMMNKISFPLQMGAYVYSKYKDDGPIYTRLGVRYNFYTNWIVSLSLKTHFAKADYSEWAIGYKF